MAKGFFRRSDFTRGETWDGMEEKDFPSCKKDGKPKMLRSNIALLVAVARMQEKGKTDFQETWVAQNAAYLQYAGSGEKAREKKTA